MNTRLPKGMNIVPKKDVTQVILYQTEIVTIDHVKKSLTLRTGGWYTVHTKKCINLVLKEYGIILSQSKGEWFISRPGHLLVPFVDNMNISI